MPRRGKSADLSRWLEQRRPAQIGEAEFALLQSELAPVSEGYLRRLVRQCGVPLDPMVEGVRQATLDELEGSLLRLLAEYQSSNSVRRMAVRRLVITAKEHARLAARARAKGTSKGEDKEEMVLWLATWLENPPVFPEWVRIRKQVAPPGNGG